MASNPPGLTDYHAKYFAHELTRRCPADSVEKLAAALADAQVDLNPHQVDAYTCSAQEPPADYRVSPSDKSNMAKYVFGGFVRCLYPVQKFDSDAERRLAAILERDASRWFKPAKGQFQIYYRQGAEHLEYQPDFVAESNGAIYMLEPKASNEMQDPVVLAKKESALKWCRNASEHAASHGGKPWRYALIPHTAIAENMTLKGLVQQYGA